MSEQSMYERASRIADHLRARVDRQPTLGLILGSGLGAFADSLDEREVIPYKEIPGFPQTRVEGHKGNLVLGRVADQDVVVMQGRIHYYESRDMAITALPTQVLHLLGAETLFVTNSSGGINTDFDAGDLMLISDHINMMGSNPLMGDNDSRFGPRFPDMSAAYDPELRATVRACAEELEIPLREGVYCAVTGPSYETPAEIRLLGRLGADAVGMSTIPEVIVARHMGMRCVGISCVTNLAAGLGNASLSHDEVTETASRVSERFVKLVRRSLERILS